MINKYWSIFFVVIMTMTQPYLHCANYTIRKAIEGDLGQLMELNRAISFEYFQPLFWLYSDSALAKDTTAILEADLLSDQDFFLQATGGAVNKSVFLALDYEDLVGFIFCSLHESNIHFDLILIGESHRHSGIGKKLIEAACKEFVQAKICSLIVLDKNMVARRAYETLGFVQKEMLDIFRVDLPSAYPNLYVYYEIDRNYLLQRLCKKNTNFLDLNMHSR